ncbi:MAG: envelope stress response membrane protein PspB [Woeseiaceae bacterium]|nr:envelope stress response membrane protein PspB [Woeseiaceae bacterium]
MAELAIILALTVVAPLAIILHFVTKWKQGREISGDDEKMLEDLYLLSQRMEDRLVILEKILDDELPDWRRKYYEPTHLEH